MKDRQWAERVKNEQKPIKAENKLKVEAQTSEASNAP